MPVFLASFLAHPIVAGAVGFLKSPLGKWLMVALAVFLALWAAWLNGDHHGVEKQKAAQARAVAAQRAKVVKTEAKAAQITTAIGQKSEARQVQIRTITKTIIEKVPVYVDAKADAQCVVPLGFVRLHDAAAGGRLPEVPGPSGKPDDAPSGVALSAVAGTLADNYGTYHETAERLTSLQDWIRQQAANQRSGP